MRKKYTVSLILAIILVFASVAGAQQSGTSGAGTSNSGVSPQERTNAFLIGKIVGSQVTNIQGQVLGKIQDLIVDVDSGRILYAVLDIGGFLGIRNKLFPVPWDLLAALPSEGRFFIDKSKDELRNAPSYDKNNLPDVGDVHWGDKIAEFYKATREEKTYNYGDPKSYSYDLYPELAREDPFKDVFNPKTIENVSGEVIRVNYVVPKSGVISQIQIQLILYVERKRTVPVFVAPRWYLDPSERKSFFRTGDKVDVTGSRITSMGLPFIVATTITRGNDKLQLRDKDGAPAWQKK